MVTVAEGPVPMIAVHRGGALESLHQGHAVVCDAAGQVVAQWGNPDALIFPRSSCKMIQALPLLESGAGAGLGAAQLALACASHSGAVAHVGLVARWLDDLGMAEGDLRCGAHEPGDTEERNRLIRAGEAPCQLHNNCSGKHTGFLMLNRHIGGGPEYVDPDHPVQKAVRAAFEAVTGEESPGFGIDGCSAPNFLCSLGGLARAMAGFAAARADGDHRQQAMVRLREAMVLHPDLVAGEGRACTELMRATGGQVALKTGADGVYVAIVPGRGLGIALKMADGASRGSEAAIVAILVHLGLLDPAHPAARKRLGGAQVNWRGLTWGELRPAPGFP